MKLLGLGNPLLDISAEVDDQFLARYGLKANNAILADASHLMLYKELIDQYKVSYVAGGATQNTIRGAQWLLPPNETAYIGCVGEDEFADQLTKAATADGVSVHYMKTNQVPTGTCAVLLTNRGAYRSLVANLSAAEKYHVDHLMHVWDSVVANAHIYYISGFFLTVSPASIMKIAHHVHDHSGQTPRKLLCMNLSAPFIPLAFSKPLLEALPYVDYLFGNETEAVSFAEMSQWPERDVLEIAKKILVMFPKSTGKRTIVFTQGSSDVITASLDYDTTDKSVTAAHHPIIPIPDDRIVDTNGAGDAFVGGFLAQLVKGQQDLDACIKAGVWTAHIVIQQNGPVYPKSVTVPTDFSTLTYTQVDNQRT